MDVLNELGELLEIARSAARKLWASYARREISPRAEFDRLIAAEERIHTMLLVINKTNRERQKA